MRIYKSSVFVMVKNVVYGVFGGAVAALVANFFLETRLAVGAGAVLGLLIIYLALVGNNIRIVVEDDNFAVYKGRKCKHRFVFGEVSLSAKIKSSSGDSDCELTVTNAQGERTSIDCSMLGASRFYKLLDALHVTGEEPVVLGTKKK